MTLASVIYVIFIYFPPFIPLITLLIILLNKKLPKEFNSRRSSMFCTSVRLFMPLIACTVFLLNVRRAGEQRLWLFVNR